MLSELMPVQEAIKVASPGVGDILLAALVLGVLAAGITEIVKILVEKTKAAKDNPPWWKATLRLIPLTLGAVMGIPFFHFPWGVGVGAGAGILSAVLYKKVRAWVKALNLGELLK